MKLLANHRATSEQLPIVSRILPGIIVIRGAAGSGKTTSALLRLNAMIHASSFRNRNAEKNIKVLVLSFNRTLAGYIQGLIDSGSLPANLQIENETFSNWAKQNTNSYIIDDKLRDSKLYQLANAAGINYDMSFLLDEIDYIRGRFRLDEIDAYLTVERTGRGISPQVTRQNREKLITVILEYQKWITELNQDDWHTIANKMQDIPSLEYNVVVVDETQDFSANQIRAIKNHLANEYYLTFVIDTIQRLYPRGFTWKETGLNMSGVPYYRLNSNYRNTREIARFASCLTDGLVVDDDGAQTDQNSTQRSGSKPTVVVGYYYQQVSFALDYINENVDLSSESVAFLKPRGGMFFSHLKNTLEANNMSYVELTKARDWPDSDVNIALCTMNSAKGLEFDHVIILGLNNANADCGDSEDEEKNVRVRRLLSMAICRARESVILGYKESEKPRIIDYFNSDSYKAVLV